jgi:hypothetical protein
VVNRILAERNGTGIIVHEGKRFVAKAKLKTIEQKLGAGLHLVMPCTLSVVDRTTVGWRRLFQATVPPYKHDLRHHTTMPEYPNNQAPHVCSCHLPTHLRTSYPRQCQDKAISSPGHVTACAVPLPLFN